ncbi:hypothetical protein HDU82_003780, partial [Entophlyctis luteolus]
SEHGALREESVGENQRIIEGVAAQLKVFTSKDDAVNAKQPMRLSAPVGDRGASEDSPLFVVVPKNSSVGSKDIASVVSEVVRRELMLLMEPENTLSPAAIGFRCLDELRRASRFASIPKSEGPAILSVENAALMAEIPDEKLVVQFTWIFGKILSPDLIVVNSEEYNWLQQASYLPDKINLKPDLFTTYRGLFCQRNEPNDKVTDLRQFYRHSKEQVFYFGVPEISLLDSIVIMEAKKELSMNDDFGKVAILAHQNFL